MAEERTKRWELEAAIASVPTSPTTSVSIFPVGRNGLWYVELSGWRQVPREGTTAAHVATRQRLVLGVDAIDAMIDGLRDTQQAAREIDPVRTSDMFAPAVRAILERTQLNRRRARGARAMVAPARDTAQVCGRCRGQTVWAHCPLCGGSGMAHGGVCSTCEGAGGWAACALGCDELGPAAPLVLDEVVEVERKMTADGLCAAGDEEWPVDELRDDD